MEVLYLGEAQMDRCWNCGTRLQALEGSAPRKRARQRLPLARFLVALLGPAGTGLLIWFFYNSVAQLAPWIRMFWAPQLIGVSILAFFCAIDVGYLLGRNKSESVQALTVCLVCILVVANLTFVALAAVNTH